MSTTTYNIKLPQFEGPFDLLLFFIERDELDIYDIPIHTITEDFLAYMRHLEQLNIDLASEFILVAATLCRIKAKLLLPRKPVDDEGNEIDPREELVSRLLEYKRYKSVLDELRQLEEDRANKSHRGNVVKELQDIATRALVDVEMESVTLFKLLKAFEKVMQRFDNNHPGTIHQIVQYAYTIEDQQAMILSKVKPNRKTGFKDIFKACKDRIHAIITFLALLELLNLQMIKITLGEGVNSFWLSPYEVEEEGDAMVENEETPQEENDETTATA